MIIVLTTIVGLTITLAVLVYYLHNTQNTPKSLLGELVDNTARSQVNEILNHVLENESLFNLVKDNGAIFHGHKTIDCFHINTSKFAKLCIKVSTVPMQLTSAERYFRLFKYEILNNNKIIINE